MKAKIDFSKDGVLKTIYPYIKEKEVLDIGCIEHDLNRKHKERIWVHDFLRENANHVTGIDILKDDIKTLKSLGYDVYNQSAETFNFNKKYDVIFAGELIEHLSNPGLFLQRSKNHLKKNGTLIITTPNAYSLERLLRILKSYTNDPDVNKEHTVWFSPAVITELLSRYNLSVLDIKFVDYPRIKPKLIYKVSNSLCKVFGNKFRENMILIAK
jgi:2-polyprenyl-3-methyl-5-hydroxy-6-metoxy-1,4-benzoquinol methylase